MCEGGGLVAAATCRPPHFLPLEAPGEGEGGGSRRVVPAATGPWPGVTKPAANWMHRARGRSQELEGEGTAAKDAPPTHPAHPDDVLPKRILSEGPSESGRDPFLNRCGAD